MGNGSRRYEVKRCPRCDSELYADMDVCYGCLYDFSRDAPRETSRRSAAERSLAMRHADEVGVVVRGPALEVWTPVGDGGAVVGGSASCDVILRAPPVSDRHLRLVPTSDGMEVSDLGPSVRATYRSRPIDRCVVVPYGDSVDVCGYQLTMTGPRPTSPCRA